MKKALDYIVMGLVFIIASITGYGNE